MHIPVLLKEVIEYLDPKANENFIDCTLGQAGHTLAILGKTGPSGRVLGIDQDSKSLELAKQKISEAGFNERFVPACGNFVDLKNIIQKEKFNRVSGIILDLGMSSWQLEESEGGFSFLKDEPLDMRFAREGKGLAAWEIINIWPEEEIVNILKNYGEEKFSNRIAKEILKTRKAEPIRTTFQLAEAVRRAVPAYYEKGRIHPSTRTFQALRIAVNDELQSLAKALPQALEVLEGGGRIAVISFHSLEDRIVKNFFREKSKENLLKILTKKPIQAGQEEMSLNPRSRSAKLRAIIKN